MADPPAIIRIVSPVYEGALYGSKLKKRFNSSTDLDAYNTFPNKKFQYLLLIIPRQLFFGFYF